MRFNPKIHVQNGVFYNTRNNKKKPYGTQEYAIRKNYVKRLIKLKLL